MLYYVCLVSHAYATSTHIAAYAYVDHAVSNTRNRCKLHTSTAYIGIEVAEIELEFGIVMAHPSAEP